MDIFDIHIAFVSWGSGGKSRPVLILEENTESATVFSITSQYESKSEEIRAKYFVINEWKQAGLEKLSYIDTNNTITLPLSAIDSESPIGKLTAADETRLLEFMNQ